MSAEQPISFEVQTSPEIAEMLEHFNMRAIFARIVAASLAPKQYGKAMVSLEAIHITPFVTVDKDVKYLLAAHLPMESGVLLHEAVISHRLDEVTGGLIITDEQDNALLTLNQPDAFSYLSVNALYGMHAMTSSSGSGGQ